MSAIDLEMEMVLRRVDDTELACERVQIVATKGWVNAIDDYRVTKRPIPSRSDVIRIAVAQWLAQQQKGEPK